MVGCTGFPYPTGDHDDECKTCGWYFKSARKHARLAHPETKWTMPMPAAVQQIPTSDVGQGPIPEDFMDMGAGIDSRRWELEGGDPAEAADIEVPHARTPLLETQPELPQTKRSSSTALPPLPTTSLRSHSAAAAVSRPPAARVFR